MRNRLFTLLVVATAVIAVTALDSHDAAASASFSAVAGGARSTSASSSLSSGVPPCGPFADADADAGAAAPQASSADCPAGGGLCPHGGRAHACANAFWPAMGGALHILLLLPPGHGAAGKGAQPDLNVVVEDTVECQLTLISGTTYELSTKGRMKCYPAGAADETWAYEEVSIYEEGNDSNSPFYGKIVLVPFRYHALGGYANDTSFHDSIVSDTLILTFDARDTVTYTGDPDKLTLRAVAHKRGANVPTTTEWGVIALVALLVSSAVFIMLRKKKASVAA